MYDEILTNCLHLILHGEGTITKYLMKVCFVFTLDLLRCITLTEDVKLDHSCILTIKDLWEESCVQVSIQNAGYIRLNGSG